MPKPTILLLSPNVSSRMGGEAMKALQICSELTRQGYDVHQVTHERVRQELAAEHPQLKVHYVKDGLVQVLLDKVGWDWLLVALNVWQINRRARKLARELNPFVVHATSPISPVMPHLSFPGHPLVLGPLNGNIYHPPAFRTREPPETRLSRNLLVFAQPLLGAIFRGKRSADTLLVAGGERTLKSLKLAGCSERQIVQTLDSGVPNELAAAERIRHSGHNFDFVFVGRLIPLKGCDLAIRAIANSCQPLRLDVIGDGPSMEPLRRLADELQVRDRVRFLGWIPGGSQLYKQLGKYRGFVFPSLADANGIVVQEAMMIGLPVICLKWGGPESLVTSETGILVEPRDEAFVVEGLTGAMDALALDGERADRMAGRARQLAESHGFTWEQVILSWYRAYERAVRSSTARQADVAGRSTAGVLENKALRPARSTLTQEAVRLWQVSRRISEDDERHPSFKLRVRFFAHALRHRDAMRPLLNAPAESRLGQLIAARPQMLGIAMWPYICSTWTAEERIAHLTNHFETVQSRMPFLAMNPHESITILDLGELYGETRLVLDSPQWFMREGQLVMNLFVGAQRMFSLAFDLTWTELGLEAWVGAIQGVDVPGARERYKEMTKAFHGLRPRDLLFELFRALTRALGVTKIYGIADEFRHHRSAYFGISKVQQLSLNYDEIWLDRGGEFEGTRFFTIPVSARKREDIPAKKRAMYTRRQMFLEEAEAKIEAWIEARSASAPDRLVAPA